MKNNVLTLVLLAGLLMACGPRNSGNYSGDVLNPSGNTLETRIYPPKGFERIPASPSSYAGYLRQLPVKPDGAEVALYDGRTISNNGKYVAVIKQDIGHKDLHQCADAVMRLRAEYLWQQGDYEDIHFNFTNGFNVSYTEWMAGKRVVVKGNKSYWKKTSAPSNTEKDLWNYLETIFMYAGSLSLSKELKQVPVHDMKIGDVFIRGGSPGHAMLVIDMAVNAETGEKLFLLAQSYTPAQQTHIVANPLNSHLSPWYSLDFGSTLVTPGYVFQSNQLKRF